jgi:hypothetical protein
MQSHTAIIDSEEERRRRMRGFVDYTWISLSAFFLALSIRMVVHHDQFGWCLAPIWSFVLLIRIRHLFKTRKMLGRNGQGTSPVNEI